MKKGFVFLLLIVIILALWWIYQSSLEAQKKQSTSPNVVSFVAAESQTTKSEIRKKPTQPKQSEPSSEITTTIHFSDKTITDSELSYLDVYRMTRQFESCQNVIYRLQEEDSFDPVASFKKRTQHLQALYPDFPTPTQISAVTQHANQCEQLLNTVQSLDLPDLDTSDGKTYAPMYQLKRRLKKYLLSLQPKSPKERAIAEVLNLIVNWQKHYKQVLVISTGEEETNKVEIEALKEQLSLLRNEQLEFSQQHHDSSDSVDLSRIGEILIEIEKLEKQVFELKLVNPEAREQAIEAFETVNELLFTQLKSRDPDVFYEAQKTLELNTRNYRDFGYFPYKDHGGKKLKVPFVEYVSPGDVIKDILGFDDNESFGLVINYATQLYHCELGADCGPEGNWTPFYCHLGYDNLLETACQHDLPTFYRDYFLNQNQWQDVQMVLDIIRGLYAN